MFINYFFIKQIYKNVIIIIGYNDNPEVKNENCCNNAYQT